MTRLSLIGIGTGNPDHLTRAGAAAIRGADVVLLPEKGDDKSDLADLRREIIAQVAPDGPVTEAFALPVRDDSLPYGPRVDAWHDEIAAVWTRAMARHPAAKTFALLVWGDPSLYDSTLRIAARLVPAPTIKVIPGITSLQALTAAHSIPLNEINAPVLITTGRQLRDHGWPAGQTRVAVMLDGGCAFQGLSPGGIHIWWGAFLGMPNEVLVSGPLVEVGPRIVETRARARAEHGWIMDTYLLSHGAPV